ncbi:hypothetical protein [Pararhizobium sp. DWP3-4]|uniref:hypothetical protein n=1 Tax=Pararhizobium sp. DWP3-4 TaxID=2804565 RepID=UPI003CEC2B0D
MMEWSATTATWLSAAGICWDISGGILLSKGLLMSDNSLSMRSGSYWGSSPPAVRGLCEQRIDAKFGLWQLLAGFFLQLLSSAGLVVADGVAFLMILPIAFVWHYYTRNFPYWAGLASLKFVGDDVLEENWRKHFSDLDESTWRRINRRANVIWKEPPTKTKPA